MRPWRKRANSRETTGVKLSLFSENVEVTDSALVGKVVSTTPAPGAKIVGQGSVTLFIGVLADDAG